MIIIKQLRKRCLKGYICKIHIFQFNFFIFIFKNMLLKILRFIQDVFLKKIIVKLNILLEIFTFK